MVLQVRLARLRGVGRALLMTTKNAILRRSVCPLRSAQGQCIASKRKARSSLKQRKISGIDSVLYLIINGACFLADLRPALLQTRLYFLSSWLHSLLLAYCVSTADLY